ncbi:MAG: DnaJ domain-containing protein, partial [Betaproteobacteria bacterium]
MKDYYRILGVLDDAEDIIIRAAYKALAQRYHPDKWTGDKEQANRKMSEINEAYEVLSDAAKRKAYDE